MENDLTNKESAASARPMNEVAGQQFCASSQSTNMNMNQQSVGMQQGVPDYRMYAQQNNVVDYDKKNNKKKLFLTVGIISLVAVMGIVALVINMFSGSSASVKKTVTCKETGLVADYTYEFGINDGEIVQYKTIQERDLSNYDQWLDEVGYDSEEKYIADIDDDDKKQCNSMAGCTYDSNYDKGRVYIQTIIYEGKALDSMLSNTGDMSKYTAQEIADRLQEAFSGEDKFGAL